MLRSGQAEDDGGDVTDNYVCAPQHTQSSDHQLLVSGSFHDQASVL